MPNECGRSNLDRNACEPRSLVRKFSKDGFGDAPAKKGTTKGKRRGPSNVSAETSSPIYQDWKSTSLWNRAMFINVPAASAHSRLTEALNSISTSRKKDTMLLQKCKLVVSFSSPPESENLKQALLPILAHFAWRTVRP
jgi:hypothetical protein